MNKINVLIVLFFTSIALITGCATKGGTDSQKTENVPQVKQELPRIVGDIPPNSPFSKIKIGMPMGQVNDLIGQPNDQTNYATGKTFIPFYFGSDSSRIEAYYKGQGRITFTGGSGFGARSYKVYRIVYDASENGYNER